MKPSEIEIEFPNKLLEKLEHFAATKNCSVEELVNFLLEEFLKKLENESQLP